MARFSKSLFALIFFGAVLALGTEKFTAHDLNLLTRVGTPVLSPDKTRYVYSANLWNEELNRKSTNLFMKTVNNNEDPIRLGIFGYYSDSSPVWADNGKSILFLSNRGGSSQIWQVYIADPETLHQVSQLPIDVQTFKLAADSQTIIFSAYVFPGKTIEETAAKNKEIAESRTSAMAWDNLFVRRWDTFWTGTYSHVFTVDLKLDVVTNALYFATQPIDHMFEIVGDCPSRPFGGAEEYDLSPDKSLLAYTTQLQQDIAWSTDLNVYVVNTKTAEAPTCITCDNPATDSAPLFSPDGSLLAFTSMRQRAYESDRARLSIYNFDTKQLDSFISEDWEISFGAMEWSSDQLSIFLCATDRAEDKVFKFNIASRQGAHVAGAHLTSGYNVLPCVDDNDKECFLYSMSSFTTPAEIYMTNSKNEVTQLTNYNTKTMEKFAIAETIQFTYTGAEAAEVQAFVFKPSFFEAGKKYPLLVMVHGGPETPWQDNFHYRWNVQPFTAEGYAVVMPNVHGSGSFGDAFKESIRNDWGGKPYDDLLLLIDALGAEYDWIDTENAGALGASYGGYMINWINSQTDRFKCLICHDGMFDVGAFYYYTDELYFVENEFGGTPFADPIPEAYTRFNPASFVANMKTPQLIIHGSTDYRIPDVSGIGMFTALQRQGIESRLVLFPEENHWVLNPNNSIRWHEEVINWLAKYLKK